MARRRGSVAGAAVTGAFTEPLWALPVWPVMREELIDEQAALATHWRWTATMIGAERRSDGRRDASSRGERGRLRRARARAHGAGSRRGRRARDRARGGGEDACLGRAGRERARRARGLGADRSAQGRRGGRNRRQEGTPGKRGRARALLPRLRARRRAAARWPRGSGDRGRATR